MRRGRQEARASAGRYLVLALALLLAGCARGSKDVEAKTILATGFGPFPGTPTNPSWEALATLDGRVVGGAVVRVARLDVAWDRAVGQLEAAVRETRPAAILCLGVAPEDRFRIEVAARNADGPQPDVDGTTRPGGPIHEGAPAILPTRLPVQRLFDALRAGGYEVRTSDDAGAYLCNHLFYVLEERVAGSRPAGFVHVPPLGDRWDVERIRQGVLKMLEVIAREIGRARRS